MGVSYVCPMLSEEPSPRGAGLVRVQLWVRDSGIGMSPEFREKIFESFSREDSARVYKTEGTGLGMAITKYIVDAMQGSIKVQSEQGKGTEFHLSLDLEMAENRDDEMMLPGWRMLVVDDDRQLCESAAGSLRSIGLQAEWVQDGESALERPDAARIPIIAMTADAFSEDVRRCLDCGMDARAAKPINVREVSQLLERLLRGSA